MTAPLRLSIVLTGRNDNYGGDFNQRFFRALRFNVSVLLDAGIDFEVVFVEWAPIEDRERLSTILVREFAEQLGTRLTACVVDGRYHTAMNLNPKVRYLEFVAKNVGLRRAAGHLVLSTNSDVFLSRHVVHSLQSNLDTDTVYRAPRYDIRLGVDQSHLTWDVLEDERNHVRRPVLEPPLLAGGTGDFLLASRECFHRLRGFNEVYRLARAGIDFNFLLKAYTSGARIVDIGGPVYHVNHVGSLRISKALYDQGRAETAWGKRNWPSRHVVYDNGDGWGLSQAPVTRVDDAITHLDFSWSAVPPLIELRRLVLPTHRLGLP